MTKFASLGLEAVAVTSSQPIQGHRNPMKLVIYQQIKEVIQCEISKLYFNLDMWNKKSITHPWSADRREFMREHGHELKKKTGQSCVFLPTHLQLAGVEQIIMWRRRQTHRSNQTRTQPATTFCKCYCFIFNLIKLFGNAHWCGFVS